MDVVTYVHNWSGEELRRGGGCQDCLGQTLHAERLLPTYLIYKLWGRLEHTHVDVESLTELLIEDRIFV